MPGPFPGMDPYIEDPIFWPGMHDSLIVHISETLNAQLPANYAASVGERLYVVQPDRSIYPDVAVLHSPCVAPRSAGGSATLVLEDPPTILTVEPVEIHDSFIEILSLNEQERIVTIIEILSHANKAANSQGRQLYLAKQRETLDSETHLLEIDLLRAGLHTVAAPRDYLQAKVNAWDYLVCLHRSSRHWDYECWPTTVRARLPRIRVPLSGADPDLILDLQVLFDLCYDTGPYTRRVNYRGAPHTPLNAEDAAWADALLHEKGLRN